MLSIRYQKARTCAIAAAGQNVQQRRLAGAAGSKDCTHAAAGAAAGAATALAPAVTAAAAIAIATAIAVGSGGVSCRVAISCAAVGCAAVYAVAAAAAVGGGCGSGGGGRAGNAADVGQDLAQLPGAADAHFVAHVLPGQHGGRL